MSKKACRDNRIDIMKGIAICLVVIGHVISGIYSPKEYQYNIIFKICYSFHMPLFIFISGYLTGLKKQEDISSEWIIKRTKRLLVPYVIWTCLKWLIMPCNNGIIITIFAFPLYWYLIVLYLFDLLNYISNRFKRKYVISVLLYLFVVILGVILGNNNMIIKRMVIYFPFYFIGYIISCKREIIIKKFSYIYLMPSILLYPISMLFYTYQDYSNIIMLIQKNIGEYSYKVIKAGVMFYNHYIVALLGIAFVWVIVSFICDKKIFQFFQKIFSYIGRYTLQIYVLHDMLFIRVFDNDMISSVLSVLTGIGGGLIIGILIKKSHRLNNLLFG